MAVYPGKTTGTVGRPKAFTSRRAVRLERSRCKARSLRAVGEELSEGPRSNQVKSSQVKSQVKSSQVKLSPEISTTDRTHARVKLSQVSQKGDENLSMQRAEGGSGSTGGINKQQASKFRYLCCLD